MILYYDIDKPGAELCEVIIPSGRGYIIDSIFYNTTYDFIYYTAAYAYCCADNSATLHLQMVRLER